MNAKVVFLLGALGLFHSLLPAVAQGNLVANGGFDTDAGGWTTNTSSGYYEPLKGYPGGCFTLISSISQNISGLVPGSKYIVSGSYAIEGGDIVNTPSFGVAIDGVFVYEVAPRDYAWHQFAFCYTATSSNALLSLHTGINGTSDHYRIDNIAMQSAPSVGVQVTGTSIVVSWPTNMIGLTLQCATNLITSSWVAVTNPPTVSGTKYSVTLSASQGVQFFSLKR